MRSRLENLGSVHEPERPYNPCMKEKEEREKSQASEAPGEECELCGGEMFGLHCKLICPNCGYRRDCSDP